MSLNAFILIVHLKTFNCIKRIIWNDLMYYKLILRKNSRNSDQAFFVRCILFEHYVSNNSGFEWTCIILLPHWDYFCIDTMGDIKLQDMNTNTLLSLFYPDFLFHFLFLFCVRSRSSCLHLFSLKYFFQSFPKSYLR